MFCLTPHVDRTVQGTNAGKQGTGKSALVGTLLGDPQEPAGRRERFRAAFPWLCAHPLQKEGPAAVWQAAAARDKEALGQTKLRRALGRQTHIHGCSAEIRKFNSCSSLRSFQTAAIEDLYLQRCCAKFSHACHSYEPY